MENFSINTQNEFNEDSEGSIVIDGMLSDAEKIEISEALEGEKDEIHDLTNGKLAQLLHSDILPHLETSDLSDEVKDDLRSLIEKHPKNTINLGINVSNDLEDTLSQGGLNLSMQRVVGDIQDYIGTELVLPSDSDISSSEYDQILQNTGVLLQGEIDGIDDIVQEAIENNSHLSLAESRWIISEKISSKLGSFKHNTLLNVKHLLEFSSPSQRENGSYKQMREHYTREADRANLTGEQRDLHIEGNIKTSTMLFKMGYQSFKELATGEAFSQSELNREHNRLFANFWTDIEELPQAHRDIDESLNISLLSEEDKQIERSANLWFMGAIAGHLAIEGGPALLASVVPGAGTAAGALVGGVLGAGIDIADMFSDKEALLEILKKAGAVPQEYHMEKTLFDNIIAGIGLIPGVTLLTKSNKLASLMRKFKVSGREVLQSMERVLPILKGDEAPEAANLNRAPIAQGKSERMDIPDEALATGTDAVSVNRFDTDTMMRNANLGPIERQAEAARTLGRELSPDESQRLLEVHEMFLQGEGSYTLRELVQKRQRLMEDDFFTKQEANILMDLGLAGDPNRLRNVFSQGERVRVPRSNGSTSEATIMSISDGKAHVQWEENGTILTKPVDITKIEKIPTIAPELLYDINSLNVGFIVQLKNGSSGYVLERRGNTLTVEITQKNGDIHQLDLDVNNLIERSEQIQDIVRYQRHEVNVPALGNIDQFMSFIRGMTEPGIMGGEVLYTKRYLLEILQDIKGGNLRRIDEITSASGLRGKVWNSISDKEKRDYMVPYLWPDGIDSHMSQGRIGNCYFIASLRCIKSHPEAKNILSRMVSLNSNGSVTVRFPGDTYQRSINITKEQLAEMKQVGGVQGSLGDRIIERAYARLIREQKEGVVDGGHSGRTIFPGSSPEGTGEKLAMEGGYAYKALKEMFGSLGREKHFDSSNMLTALNKINETNKGSIILSLGSKQRVVTNNQRVDSFTYAARDAAGNNINLYHGHAYGIENVDTINRRVLVVNPHSTQGERFWMTYEQVVEQFPSLQGLVIDRNSLLRSLEESDSLGNDALMRSAA